MTFRWHSIGKALGVFGAASGRVENSTFRRKLASIRSFFPHDEEHNLANISEIYHNLFDLLRSVVYFSPIISMINSCGNDPQSLSLLGL